MGTIGKQVLERIADGWNRTARIDYLQVEGNNRDLQKYPLRVRSGSDHHSLSWFHHHRLVFSTRSNILTLSLVGVVLSISCSIETSFCVEIDEANGLTLLYRPWLRETEARHSLATTRLKVVSMLSLQRPVHLLCAVEHDLLSLSISLLILWRRRSLPLAARRLFWN